MEERENRKASSNLKGLEVSSGRESLKIFEDVCRYIFGPGEVLQLCDIVCISRDKKMFRTKIENVETRRFLFSEDSTFSNMFINRDLTYNQLRDFFRRSEESRQLDTHSGDPTAL